MLREITLFKMFKLEGGYTDLKTLEGTPRIAQPSQPASLALRAEAVSAKLGA